MYVKAINNFERKNNFKKSETLFDLVKHWLHSTTKSVQRGEVNSHIFMLP